VQLSRPPVVPPGLDAAATTQSLLYVSNLATNDVDIFSYPEGKVVGKITEIGRPRGECADAAGNVWIADVQAFQVVEYSHGASKPVAALSTFGAPRGCSVDPRIDNLAVSGGANGTILSVYHRSTRGIWRDPRRYSDTSIRTAYFCGYDAAGNLFIDGTSADGDFRLAELPRGARALVNLTVSQSIAAPGQVQWDGKYVTVGDAGVSPSVLYRFSIGARTATKVGSTILQKTAKLQQYWIQAKTVIAADDESRVGLWKYPEGGSPAKTFGSLRAYAAAVSLP